MAKRTCSIEGCEKQAQARGWCATHYSRWKRTGTTDKLRERWHPPTSVTDRMWAKVEKTEGCWLWTGSVTSKGYGTIGEGGSALLVHRLAYEQIVGPIPEGLHIDHLCRVRHCVNPAHMEPVSPGVNVRRGVGVTAENARKTHCIHGHEFTPENTAPDRTRGGRRCRTCARERDRKYRARRRR